MESSARFKLTKDMKIPRPEVKVRHTITITIQLGKYEINADFSELLSLYIDVDTLCFNLKL